MKKLFFCCLAAFITFQTSAAKKVEGYYIDKEDSKIEGYFILRDIKEVL